MRFMFWKHPHIAKRWNEEYGTEYIKNLPEHIKRKALRHVRRRG